MAALPCPQLWSALPKQKRSAFNSNRFISRVFSHLSMITSMSFGSSSKQLPLEP
nr:MAG TPA: hypothetical protein [Caudoviricetes sp.]